MSEQQGVPAQFFHDVYDQMIPWDVHQPQPALIELAATGLFAGKALDVGCGTGDNAILLAQQGAAVTGLDFVPKALEIARQRAEAAGVRIDFRLFDVLQLAELGEHFDVVLDSALFHVFGDEDRQRLVAGLAQVIKPGGKLVLLCFSASEARPALPGGPRRIQEAEIRTAFAAGWQIDSLHPSRFLHVHEPAGAPAWLAVITRTP